MQNLKLDIFIKYNVGWLICFIAMNQGYAQFGKNCELTQLKINLINPGIEYEKALGVNTTFDIKAGLQIGLDPVLPNVYEEFALLPAIAGQYRYYYNFGKRQRKGKQIYGNSANYVAPSTAIFFPGKRTIANEVEEGSFGYIGMVTGLQRSFNSGFNFSIDVGAGYYLGKFEGAIYPIANLSFGWIINEKRWCVGR